MEGEGCREALPAARGLAVLPLPHRQGLPSRPTRAPVVSERVTCCVEIRPSSLRSRSRSAQICRRREQPRSSASVVSHCTEIRRAPPPCCRHQLLSASVLDLPATCAAPSSAASPATLCPGVFRSDRHTRYLPSDRRRLASPLLCSGCSVAATRATPPLCSTEHRRREQVRIRGSPDRLLCSALHTPPRTHRLLVARCSALPGRKEAFPLSAEELSSHEKSSFSSSFLSFLPTIGSNTDHQQSTKPGNQHGFRPMPLQSLPMRWKTKGFTWENQPLDQDADNGLKVTSNEPSEIPENILDHLPERNINGSHRKEEASISYGLRNFLSHVVDQSVFISSHLFEFLESSLPNLVKGCQWVLLYSTMKHGISLHTLIRKSADLPGPCLLIVGDMQGAVFGGLLDAPLKPTAKRKYQGTHQTFVFTTIYGDPRLFRPTGANRYYYLCLNELLAFGGGGSFALCLDDDLLHGTSGPSDTFGNLCLAYSPEFEPKNVELWGFTHPSIWLT